MFSAWYRGKGYHKLNHNRLEKYNILREFLREHIDENEWDTLDEIMLYDMYLRENVKGRPAWAKDTAQYKKEWKALYREQGENFFQKMCRQEFMIQRGQTTKVISKYLKLI